MLEVAVCGELAVDSVFATARAETKQVSRPRRQSLNNQVPRSPLRGTSNGFVAEPLADCPANRKLPPFRIDLPGQHRVGGPRRKAREDVTPSRSTARRMQGGDRRRDCSPVPVLWRVISNDDAQGAAAPIVLFESVNYPTLPLGRAPSRLRVGLPASMTRFAGTE